MKAVKLALVALPITALTSAVLHAASPERRDENVLITAVTDDPCCGSGIVAFAVGFSGRVDGTERSYFIPFLRPGQAKPRNGERCQIRWRWWRSKQWNWLLGGGGSLREGRLVTSFRCR
jgi:hypothetical protein